MWRNEWRKTGSVEFIMAAVAASELQGQWRSNTAIGGSNWISGNSDVFEPAIKENSPENSISCTL